MSDLKEYIRLVEIVQSEKPGERAEKKFWRVTLEYKVPRNAPMLQATWYIDPEEYPEDALFPLARGWTYGLCKSIADNAQDWALTKEQIDGLRRPKGAKPRS